MASEDDELARETIKAIEILARLWERPWPAFLEEFKERAAGHGLTVEELAAALSAQLHWQRFRVPNRLVATTRTPSRRCSGTETSR